MKKYFCIAAGLVLLAIGVIAQDAGTRPTTGFKGTPGPNPNFYEVARKLDQGGDFYLFLDIKDVLRDQSKSLQKIVTQIPDAGIAGVMLAKGVDLAVEALGVYDVESVGMSGMEIGEDMYRLKTFLYLPQERRGLFKVLGPAPHASVSLAYAPADAVLFSSMDLDPGAALDVTRDVVAKVGGEAILAVVDNYLTQVSTQIGTDVEALLRTLGGELAFVVSLDAAQKLTLPPIAPGIPPYEIDQPRVAIMVAAKDPKVFDLISSQLKAVQPDSVTESNAGGVKKIHLALPQNPIYPVSPVLAWDGNYIIFSLHDAYADKMLATKKNRNGLAQMAEFQKLTASLPKLSNGVAFQSKRIGIEVKRAIELVAASEPDMPPFVSSLFTDMIGGGSATVRVNDPAGIMWVASYSGLGAVSRHLKGLAPLFAAPAGVLAAIAAPNFIEAQTRAKIARAEADMRVLQVALEAFQIEINAYVTPGTGSDGANAWLGISPQSPAYNRSTFGQSKTGNTPRSWALTTPIAFISTYPTDPFAPDEKATYGYYVSKDNRKYIILSAGPDGDYDITPAQDLPADTLRWQSAILNKTYDSTNGTKSNGDLWRSSQ